jgi:hypothetical protein
MKTVANFYRQSKRAIRLAVSPLSAATITTNTNGLDVGADLASLLRGLVIVSLPPPNLTRPPRPLYTEA